MDNITHTLFALTLARTPLGRTGRGTTAALVLASNAPDVDIVATMRGAQSYLTWHRGPTHGPLGVVGLGLFVACLVAAGQRVSGRRKDEAGEAPFGRLVVVSMLGVLFHLLMDLPTSYGIRLLSPFDWHWFAVDWMPIIDFYLLFALVAGLMFGARSAAARRRNAAIVIVLMTANYGIRAVAHRQALADAPRLFGPRLPQPCDLAGPPAVAVDYWPRALVSTPREPGRRCLVELVAVPTFVSPFQWRVIAHLSNAYEIHEVDLLETQFREPFSQADRTGRMTALFPNVWTPPVFAAASTPLGRTFLGFARLAAARPIVDSNGTATVRWIDVRFADGPGRLDQPAPRSDLFSALVRIAPDGSILEQRLGR